MAEIAESPENIAIPAMNCGYNNAPGHDPCPSPANLPHGLYEP